MDDYADVLIEKEMDKYAKTKKKQMAQEEDVDEEDMEEFLNQEMSGTDFHLMFRRVRR